MVDIRSKVLNSYTATIQRSFQAAQPQIKLINYGTGSGKTYQFFHAIDKTIKKYTDIQIIGVYIAPLREHLQVEKDFYHIPSYKLNSLAMKTTDEFLEKYKRWISKILKNNGFWEVNYRKYSNEEKQIVREKKDNAKTKIKTARSIISRLEYIKKMILEMKNIRKKR